MLVILGVELLYISGKEFIVSLYCKRCIVPIVLILLRPWHGNCSTEIVVKYIKIFLLLVLCNPYVARGDSWSELQNNATLISKVDEDNAQQFLYDFYGDTLPPGSTFDWLNTRYHPHIQKYFGDLILQIMSTRLGEKICRLLNGHPLSLERSLGLSAEHGLKASKLCLDRWQVPLGKEVSGGRLWGKRRVFWLVRVPKEFDYPLDSWTRVDNSTLIIGYSHEFSKSRLLRILAHELVISYDEKYILDEQWLEEHNLKVNRDVCEFLSASNFPPLRVAFATLRALKLESQINEDLELPEDPIYSPLKSEDLSCLNQVKRMSNVIKSHRMLIKEEPYYTPLRLFCHFDSQVPLFYDRDKDWDKVFQIIAKTQLIEQSTSEIKSACEFLQEPALGTENIRYSRGPKPRLVGGW